MRRTDLALEFSANADEKGVTLQEREADGIRITEVSVKKIAETLLGKPAGRYITVHCGEDEGMAKTEKLAAVTARYIGEFLSRSASFEMVMVVGLGNDLVTPDSLGVRTIRRVPATRHLSAHKDFHELGLRSTVVIEAGVMAKTGVDTADRLHYLAKNLLPGAVIVVDSLACDEYSRLCSTIQLTDTGIAPGSGVGGARKALSSAIFGGAPVIAIGVPTVIDYDGEVTTPLMLTPRDIDLSIRRFSEIISLAINTALHPTLSRDEINSLLF